MAFERLQTHPQVVMTFSGNRGALSVSLAVTLNEPHAPISRFLYHQVRSASGAHNGPIHSTHLIGPDECVVAHCLGLIVHHKREI